MKQAKLATEIVQIHRRENIHTIASVLEQWLYYSKKTRDKKLIKIGLWWDSDKWRDYIHQFPITASFQINAVTGVHTDKFGT